MPGTRDLRERLFAMGCNAEAKATHHISGARWDGPTLILTVPDALACNTLINGRNKVQKALGDVLGKPCSIRVIRGEDDITTFSTQMRELYAFFGGTLRRM